MKQVLHMFTELFLACAGGRFKANFSSCGSARGPRCDKGAWIFEETRAKPSCSIQMLELDKGSKTPESDFTKHSSLLLSWGRAWLVSCKFNCLCKSLTSECSDHIRTVLLVDPGRLTSRMKLKTVSLLSCRKARTLGFDFRGHCASACASLSNWWSVGSLSSGWSLTLAPEGDMMASVSCLLSQH